MGVVPNISHGNFPKQGSYLGHRAKVCFHYDTSKVIEATIVREDMEEPGLTIFRLDDGRHVLATECQWSPIGAPGDPTPAESRVLVAMGDPLAPGDAPTVILGMTPASFDFMKGGLTHTFDLTKVGVPLKMVMFRGESHAEITGTVQRLSETFDVSPASEDLPDLGIDDPSKQ